MPRNQRINKLSILGTDATPDQWGFYSIFTWGLSPYGEDIDSPVSNHSDCTITPYNTTGGNIVNIFDLDVNTYWKGSGPVLIKYPYNCRIKRFGILADSCKLNLWGTTKTNPSIVSKEFLLLDDIENGSFSEVILDENKLKLNSDLGVWTSPIYELSPTSITDFIYSGNFPSGSSIKFEFRTSYDGYNWSGWTQNYFDTDSTVSLKNGYLLWKDVLSFASFSTPPVAEVEVDYYVSGAIEITGKATSPSFYRYKVQIADGDLPDEWTDVTNWITSSVPSGKLADLDTTGYEDGYYIVKLKVEDTAGQQKTDTEYFYIDNTAPVITVPNSITASGIYTLYGSITEDNIKEWLLFIHTGSITPLNLELYGDEEVTTEFGQIDLRDFENGSYTLTIKVYDMAGNTTTKNITLVVDDTYPSINSFSISPTIFSSNRGSGNCTIESTFNLENGTVVIDILDGETVVKNLFSGVVAEKSKEITWDGTNESDEVVVDGDYTVRLRFTSGGTTIEKTGTVKFDTTSPIATITFPTASQDISNFVEIIGTASDKYFYKYEIWKMETDTWALVKDATTSITNGFLGGVFFETSGLHRIKLKVHDSAGNITEASVSVTSIILPTAEVDIKETKTSDIEATLLIPYIYDILSNVWIPGYSYDILSTANIKKSFDIQSTLEIPVSYAWPMDQIKPRNYIQVRVTMQRDENQDIYLNAMNIGYSLDWFPVATNITISGTTIISPYSEDLQYLMVEPNKEIAIYEMVEVKKI